MYLINKILILTILKKYINQLNLNNVLKNLKNNLIFISTICTNKNKSI